VPDASRLGAVTPGRQCHAFVRDCVWSVLHPFYSGSPYSIPPREIIGVAFDCFGPSVAYDLYFMTR
jgi:hypothetical protein